MENVFYMDTPAGVLEIRDDGCSLTAVRFALGEVKPGAEASPLARRARAQLSEYFAGRRKTFDLPLAARGTPFQQKVWDFLRRIPYGQTRSYGQIAAAAGNPRACRAVGMANNKNPLGIVVPCHRVVGANGALTGYAGGLDKKAFLLELEKKNS